ncbi:MAG: oxygen-independent coproporphyrinogen oxidase [Bacteroidota bacterium]|jgi:oxygen-independent coproporphyrinogen-3 oxidase
MNDKELLQKYNVPGPRYTSYPTVPFWKNQDLKAAAWLEKLSQKQQAITSSLGIYIHLPFCESLCTFCGCHKRITKNHQVEAPYIDSVLQEWDLYQAHLSPKNTIKELHLGGGTPTFFAPEELARLTRGILGTQQIDPNACDLSFEAHPGATSAEHLKILYELGYRRVSFGIQDYDPIVQQAIHRVQSFELVKRTHQQAKDLGYSVNHDLVYGLPFQNLNGFADTIEKTIALLPERIALYGYAHVPWVKGTGQRGYNEANLPQDAQKRALYELAYEKLLAAGYLAIGMDHFALPSDALAQAFEQKSLHRNFMGYTHRQTDILLGLGMSSISDCWTAFAQNDKTVEAYQAQIAKGELAVFKGHFLNEEELIIRRHILDLMCHFETKWIAALQDSSFYRQILSKLECLLQDELIAIDATKLEILPKGYAFVRNVCMAFDLDLQRHMPDKPLFSATI